MKIQMIVDSITRGMDTFTVTDAYGRVVTDTFDRPVQEQCEVQTITLLPATRNKHPSKDARNNFATGRLELTFSDLEAAGKFVLGKVYSIDFTPATES